MNFVLLLNKKRRSNLSKLGVNCHWIRENTNISLKEIYVTILYCKEKVQLGDDLILEEIAESKLFKHNTLFKDIWLYDSNIDTLRLWRILQHNPSKKDALIERFNMMLVILAATIGNN